MADDQSSSELLPLSNVHKLEPESTSSNPIQQKGLAGFVFENWFAATAFISGTACCMAVFGYTWSLVDKPLGPCPDWATDCHIDATTAFFSQKPALIQGVIGTAYSIGLMAMFPLLSALAQAALWPILHKTEYDLSYINTYLSASGGSRISMALSLVSIRCRGGAVVLLSIATAGTFTTLAPFVVGQAYTKHSITVAYTSDQIVGGGIGLEFQQISPAPAPIPAPAIRGATLFRAWSTGQAEEPLDEYWNYIMDRGSLSAVGNFTPSAVSIDMSVSCSPHLLNLTRYDSDPGNLVQVATNFPTSDSQVLVRNQPAMTTWIEEIASLSETRSNVTVVFAVINGTIEGGATTGGTKEMVARQFANVSAVACAVDVDLRDYMATDLNIPVLSSLNSTGPPNTKITHPGTAKNLSSVAAWFGAATSVMGINVQGAQPMFDHGSSLPVPFTTTVKEGSPYWNISQLIQFIHTSAGAIAMSMPGNFPCNCENDTVPFPSSTYDQQALTKWRVLLLIAPIATVVLACAVLAAFDVAAYGRTRIPAMRVATVSELVRSSQTADIREAVDHDTTLLEARNTRARRLRLEDLRVKFGIDGDGRAGFVRGRIQG